jgi:hypothetical protein
MATVNELYQQYLLTQPGVATSQNTYQQLLAKMQPFVNPYPESKGLVSGTTTTTTPRPIIPMGTYSDSGSGSGSGSGGGMTTPFDSMTNAEKAAFYAANPTLASITQFGQGLFANTSLGKLQNYFSPGFVNEQGLIAMGVDPKAYQAAKESFRASEIAQMNADAAAAAQAAAQAQASADTAAINVSSPTAISATSMQNALNDDTAAINAMNALTAAGVPNATAQEMAASYFSSMQDAAATGIGGSPADVDGGGGGSFSDYGLGFNDAAAQAAADADSAATGYGGSPADADSGPGGYSGGYDSGGYGGYDGFAKGGKVTKNRLKGPDPKGPDQGYGALLSGEFVIKKSAVKKYGEGLLGMINDGKIPVQKMKSLLG